MYNLCVEFDFFLSFKIRYFHWLLLLWFDLTNDNKLEFKVLAGRDALYDSTATSPCPRTHRLNKVPWRHLEWLVASPLLNQNDRDAIDIQSQQLHSHEYVQLFSLAQHALPILFSFSFKAIFVVHVTVSISNAAHTALFCALLNSYLYSRSWIVAFLLHKCLNFVITLFLILCLFTHNDKSNALGKREKWTRRIPKYIKPDHILRSAYSLVEQNRMARNSLNAIQINYYRLRKIRETTNWIGFFTLEWTNGHTHVY